MRLHVASAALQEVHVYVDGTGGSESNPTAAWVFVCALSQIGELVALGYHASPLPMDPTHPEYVGADILDSASAELSSMTWALLWLLQSQSTLLWAFSSCHLDML